MACSLEELINDMLVKSRLFVKAATARDEALAVTCRSSSKEDEIKWSATVENTEIAHKELHDAIGRLHAARDKT